MKKPILLDFGLSETEMESFQSTKKYIEWACLIFTPAAIAAVLISCANALRWSWGDFLGLSLVCAWPYGVMLGYGVSSIILSFLFKPQFSYEQTLKKYEKWFIRTQQEFWLSLSPRAFELEVTNLLNLVGMKATACGGIGDKGVDITLGDGTIVQCKTHKNPVTPGYARELYGTLMDFKAPKAILVSTSGFTIGVRKFIIDKPITLWDMMHLIGLQKQLDK